MEFMRIVFQVVYGLFNYEFNLMGFNISFWQITIWAISATLVIWFIKRVFE